MKWNARFSRNGADFLIPMEGDYSCCDKAAEYLAKQWACTFLYLERVE